MGDYVDMMMEDHVQRQNQRRNEWKKLIGEKTGVVGGTSFNFGHYDKLTPVMNELFDVDLDR